MGSGPLQHERATDADRPRDVVYVIASMITGGTQTHLLQIFGFLDRRRYRPKLFCLRDGGNLIPAAKALDVDVRTFGMAASMTSPKDVLGFVRMVMALRRTRPAVVHAYLLRGNFFGALAAKVARIAVVVTSKRGLHQPTGAPERVAVAVSNRLSSTITGNAPSVLDFTRAVEPQAERPLAMIPSGIDTDRFDPATTDSLRAELGLGDAPVIGTAFTWRPRKGFRMLFEAFATVKAKHPAARLLLAGVAEWDPDPRELADALGIRDAVVLLGKRSDMPRVLMALDVFVLPSESEGMSNALLEAMAMGKPVVATAVGGNVDCVDEGRSGYLVAYPDSASLAARILTLVESPSRSAEMGRDGRARVVQVYSARSMVRQIEALYDRLLDRGNSSHASEPARGR